MPLAVQYRHIRRTYFRVGQASEDAVHVSTRSCRAPRLQHRSKSLIRRQSWKHETYSEHLRQKIVRATEPGFLEHPCVWCIGSTLMTDAVGALPRRPRARTPPPSPRAAHGVPRPGSPSLAPPTSPSRPAVGRVATPPPPRDGVR
jgi:hypothetical protein